MLQGLQGSRGFRVKGSRVLGRWGFGVLGLGALGTRDLGFEGFGVLGSGLDLAFRVFVFFVV